MSAVIALMIAGIAVPRAEPVLCCADWAEIAHDRRIRRRGFISLDRR